MRKYATESITAFEQHMSNEITKNGGDTFNGKN